MFVQSLASLVLVAGLAQPVAPASSPEPAQANAKAVEPAAPDTTGTPRVEVVFVLDTTGSMGGLLDGAQKKIWAIANAIASCKPAPKLKVGLVAYRDRGDEYVTQITQLTDDLDAVYTRLMALKANGGGDGPESVNQALNEAVTKIDWTPAGEAAQANTLRLIYLVGDAPPHMDYPNDVKHADSCAAAMKKGLIINAIQCGSDTTTTPVWQTIAQASEGAFFKIAQAGGVVAIATPHDDTLIRLNAEMEQTALAYGDSTVKQEMLAKRRVQEGISALAGAGSTAPATKAAAADRAVYNTSVAGSSNLWGRQDLVTDVLAQKVKLADLKEEDLPDQMKAMTPEQREEFVASTSAKRKSLQQQIDAASEPRAAFIKTELTKAGSKHDSFDDSVLAAFRDQAGKKGVRFEQKQLAVEPKPLQPDPKAPQTVPPTPPAPVGK